MSPPPRFDPRGAPTNTPRSEPARWLRRWSLDLLSARGWRVLIGGLLCLLLAYMLGRHELMALGCALIALVAGAWVLVRLTPVSAELVRTLPQNPVSVAEIVPIGLQCDQHAAVQEILPTPYPPAPIVQMPGVFDYEIIFRERGIHQLGPARQAFSDPCGLVAGMVNTRAVDQIAVRAQWQHLNSTAALGERRLSGEAHHTHNAEVDYYDVGIREHQQGDSMRQVHWKATARHGKLMVRQENYVATAHSLIVVDRRFASWHTPADQPLELPQGPGLTLRSTQRFEKALSLSCSIAQLYASHGYQLLIQDTGGQDLSALPRLGAAPDPPADRFEGFHAATAHLDLTQEQGPALPDAEIFTESLHRTLLEFADEPVFLVLGNLSEVQARALAGLAGSVRNVELFLLSEHPDRQRHLEEYFLRTSWRFHLPEKSWTIRQMWDTP